MLPQKKTDSFRLEPVPDQHIEVKDKPRRKWYIGETSVWVFLFLYLIAIAYPLLWMVMSAFKNSDDIFEHSWSLPSSWHPENFVSAWNQGISSYFMNSVIVTALTCVITVFISAWAAYGLSWAV